MGIAWDVFSFINALPDAVLILDQRRGKFIAANAVFFKLMGFAKDAFVDTPIYKLPLKSKETRHGLLRLFLKASRQNEYSNYSFRHVCPDGTVLSLSAFAAKAVLREQEYVIFNLKRAEPKGEHSVDEGGSDSWKFYKALAYEPYMEFRPGSPVHVVEEQERRMDFLHMLGESLRVKFSNSAAAKFYQGDRGGSLTGHTFLSFFNKESDAIRFLDMLSAVGQMKAETTVNTYKDFAVQVEMNCVVKFDDDGDIEILYCSQRDLSGYQRYKSIIGGSRLEMEFMFNQPFVGFAFLVPPHPLERPKIENLDATLDDMLNRITVVRANQTVMEIYGSDKSKFFMKPMAGLFNDAGVARQVLKELFVMRESSSGRLGTSGKEDDFEGVAIYRAIFDDADRLTGVFVVASRHSYGYRPRLITLN